tara:strand:+ start:287 stop:1690 length:1404 start_codon:yes stop_codon:yes gene_type:complete
MQSHSHQPGALVTQSLHGVHHLDRITKAPDVRDEAGSKLFGASLYAKFNNGDKARHNERTDDKMVLGYHCDGLPFQLVVNGMLSSDSEVLFRFIDNYITPIIDSYAERLSTAEIPADSIKLLIHEINNLTAEQSPDLQFSMSVAITYQKNNEIRCAGFGVGDCGLMLRKAQSNEVLQLTFPKKTKENEQSYDFFGDNENIDDVINRNHCFDEAVVPGDEVFGYTHLQDEMKKEVGSRDKQLRGNRSLYDWIVARNIEIYDSNCKRATEYAYNWEFGSDCMMGAITIPTVALCKKLKESIYHSELAVFNELTLKRVGDLDDTTDSVFRRGREISELASALFEEDPKQAAALARHLANCNRAVMNPDNAGAIAALKVSALKAQGKPSKLWKLLGVAMIGLGVALIAVSSLLIAGGVLGMPPAIIPGTLGIAVGASCIAMGVGMFYHGRQKSLSKEMNTLGDECLKAPQR